MKKAIVNKIADLIISQNNRSTTLPIDLKEQTYREFDAEHAFYSSLLEGIDGFTLDEVKHIVAQASLDDSSEYQQAHRY